MLTIGTQREKIGVHVYVFKGLSRGILVGSGVINYCWVSYLEGGKVRGTQRQVSENICSEDDLRSRIFETFVVKFLACLPLLGFSNV